MRTSWDQRRALQSADADVVDDLETELFVFAQVSL
jgi:hypothetical protein